MSEIDNLEKAETLASYLKDVDLPEVVKQQAVVGVALGIPGERGKVEFCAALEFLMSDASKVKRE